VQSKKQETINKSASRNIRIIQRVISIVKSARLTPYSCKYSKKRYARHKLLALILFRDFRNQYYREYIEDVGDIDPVQEILGLSVILHFTTLQKSLCRTKISLSPSDIQENREPVFSPDEIIHITAVDPSNFSSGYCNHYFSERTGKI
jgi:hypothetical protein